MPYVIIGNWLRTIASMLTEYPIITRAVTKQHKRFRAGTNTLVSSLKISKTRAVSQNVVVKFGSGR